jgi:hypothetical protein
MLKSTKGVGMDIDGIEAYGRNGFFWLKSFETGFRLVEPSAGVYFYSKIRERRGRNTGPPILFAGSKKELIKLFSQVLKELKQL